MPPEFLTRYAGVFLDVHIFPPKRHSNFRSVGIFRYIYLDIVLAAAHPNNEPSSALERRAISRSV